MIKKLFSIATASYLSIPLVFAESPLISEISPLFTESHLHLQAKNLWRYVNDVNDRKPDSKYIQSAWGQGFVANFKSGYLADTIGFNASYYGVIKLDANKNFYGRGLFYRNSQGEAKGFSKIGERYLKVKLGKETSGVQLNYGWQELRAFGPITRSYTLSPNTYLGVTSTANWMGLSLKTAYITSSIDRNSAKKTHFRGANNATVHSIFGGQLSYRNPLISASYFYGQARNYMQRHALELSYPLDNYWQLNTKVYGSFAMKQYKEMADTKRIQELKPFDHHGWHYALDAEFINKEWRLILGSGYTQAQKSQGLGRFPIHLTYHSRGTFNALTAAGNDYMRNKELSLYTRITRYINPELSVMFTANYGRFNYLGHAIQSGDISFVGKWKPQHPYLKGFGVHLMVSPMNWSYLNILETPILNKNNQTQRKHSQSIEFYITYDINLF